MANSKDIDEQIKEPKKTVRKKAAEPATEAERPVVKAEVTAEEVKGEGDGAPKKKKFTVVFRTQNSEQNSLKKRPAGAKPPVKKKPADAAAKPAADGKPARPARKKPAEAAAEPAKAAEPKAEPAKPAKTEEPKTEAPKAAEAPVKAAEPKAEPAKPAKTAKAAEPKAEEPKAAEAPAEPAKPAPRFVDMSKVREADKPVVRTRNRGTGRPAQGQTPGQGQRTGQGQGGARRQDGRPGQGQGQRAGQGQGGARRQDGRPAQGQGQGGYRGGNAQGGRPAQGQGQSQGQGGYRGGSTGGRTSGSGGGDFGGVGMSKPGTGRGKSQNGRSSGNRYDKKNSDELRRPGGVKVSNKDFNKPGKAEKKEPEEPKIKMITIPEVLTIKDLADAMKIQPAAIIKKLFLSGKIVTVNQEIDYDTAADIAVEFDVLCEKEIQVDVIEELLKDTTEDPEESLVPRPPVVCVMGHVDHGKTSLLDAIRNSNVTSREAGGITQAIGAYMVEIDDRKITFLDTPGHEAFTAMRMRGAMATDIAILVVAADDGVMPQTVEAINHAKAAGVEIIVAINKIDKPEANVDRVKQELTEYELVAEDWGGTTSMVPVSAKTGEGLEDLLEMVLLTADVKELKANPNRNARGLVIEAQLDKGRGPVATVLVQKGTLHVGDTVAAGPCYGKIRAMIDDKGRRVKEATPSTPVEILGLSDVPGAGEVFVATDTEKDARTYAETFIAEGKKKLVSETRTKVSLDDIFEQIKEGEMKELNLIVKADVQGSVEAVKTSLLKLSNDEVLVKVIHSAAGNINESDVSLASASNAIIIGFNVRLENNAKAAADQEKVDIRLYDVIYKAIEDVEAAMKGMLDPVFEERVLGHAVVRQTFRASSVGTIAGSFVLDGRIVRGCKCRVTRDGELLFDGNLASLKRFKDDAREVREGYECGLVFEGFNNLQEDDQIEAYDMVEVPRS